jgi:3(or 17)beta-hydroxysteroid dehydrogenase
MSRLDGKVVLISGAARGIGSETAQMMAKAGAKVVVGDVIDDPGRKTVAAINASGGEAQYVRLDVTREEDWTSAIGLATGRFGKLDVLVNNAGVFIGKGIEEITMDEWNKLGFPGHAIGGPGAQGGGQGQRARERNRQPRFNSGYRRLPT